MNNIKITVNWITPLHAKNGESADIYFANGMMCCRHYKRNTFTDSVLTDSILTTNCNTLEMKLFPLLRLLALSLVQEGASTHHETCECH